MSYPYPQDRHRDRKEEGEQPYAGDKEVFAQARAQQSVEAEEWGERHLRGSEDGSEQSLQDNLQDAAIEAQREIERERGA